jgi:hypothetical protein
MKFNKFLFIIVVLSLLVLGACATDGDKTRGRSAKSLDGTFIGGSQGLSLKFEEFAPPNEVFDKSTDNFDILLQLTNNGEAEVSRGLVKLSGLEPSTWGLSEVSKPMTAVNPRLKNPDGEIFEPDARLVEFTGLSYKGGVAGPQSFDVKADVCYDYKTNFQTVLCILKDPLRAKDTVCTLDSDVPLANSGGPVQITQMKETGRPGAITFTFTVEHKGIGAVYKEGSSCGFDGTQVRTDESVVSISIGEKEKVVGLKCEGFSDKKTDTSGTIRFSKEGDVLKPKKLTCTLATSDIATDYIKLVDVEMKYAHRDSITQEIKVKNSG